MNWLHVKSSRSPDRRGRPLGRWKDRVEECLGERGINWRGVTEEGRRECWVRERCFGIGKGGEASELKIYKEFSRLCIRRFIFSVIF